MRRILVAISLASLATCGAVGRAQASPMKLSIVGYAFGVPVDDSIDVSAGFSGASIPLTNFPVGAIYGTIPEGGSKAIDSSISLQATLFDSARNLASVGLSGPIVGSLRLPIGDPDVDGTVQGSATAGALEVFPGVDPARIPDWLPGLGASVSGLVTGGSLALLQSSLSITPGAPAPSGTQLVPEPGPLAAFLACAIAWLGLRRPGPVSPRIASPRRSGPEAGR